MKEGTGTAPLETAEQVKDATEALLHITVEQLAPLTSGRNSRIWRVVDSKGHPYAVKTYFRPPWDLRDRLGVEHQALSLFAAEGLTCVPAPLAISQPLQVAVYEFVVGSPVSSSGISLEDMDACAAFLCQLHQLKGRELPAIPLASDGGLSVEQNLKNLESRLERLVKGSRAAAQVTALDTFLERDFVPVWHSLRDRIGREALAAERSTSEPLTRDAQALSPSDFGFHNVLRRPDGRLVFLDFEYFGWDDPAKMMVDFLHHPGHRLRPEHKRRFLQQMKRLFPWNGALERRLRTGWTLFGLNWCLILLNEFLPGPLARRRFAGEVLEEADLQALQLVRAREMLESACSVPAGFPEEF